MSNATPVLDQMNLVVSDMEATLAFYRLLGLEIPDASVWRTASGGHHVEIQMPGGFELAFDSAALAAAYNEGWQPLTGEPSGNVLTFRMPSRQAVDDRYAELTAAGHPSLQPPYDAFWGSRYAIVADPDEQHVGLMSPRDERLRGAPPAI